MANIIEVNSSNFESVVLKSDGITVVDFWAPWCGPCKMQTPILEKIANSNDNTAKITKINTDENPDIAQKYDISSIPTLILFKNGKEVDRLIGVQPEVVLKDKFKKL